MAEVTEATADPSMEEILASIRKIISDDNQPAEETAPAVNGNDKPDVLELTQPIQEIAAVEVVKEVEPPAPPPPPKAAPAPVASSESLVSAPAASTAASALSSLANTVEIERLASTPVTASYIGNGHRTLEDMVIELMRPLLKEWLDQNLPATVERLVQKEIERIARRN